MPININDTLSMMQAVERVKAPASFLVNTFFPNEPPVAISKTIGVEYRKGSRTLAPYITAGGGVNMARETASIQYFEPPMMAPARMVDVQDVEGRAFGETLLGTMTPAERATQMQAKDFIDLQAMIQNRKNQMAAELLTTGQITVEGFADDGKVAKTDVLSYSGWTQNKLNANWGAAGTDILGDIWEASEAIQENAGVVPTVMICGKNILNYLLGNTEISKYLAISNRENLTMLSFQPRITAPQVGYLGRINALNLEIYSYTETYTNALGVATPFLGADDVIIGIPGKGKQLHGAVTLVDGNGAMQTYAAAMVPKYIPNENSNSLKLTMFSRCILAPETVDDWYHIDAGV